MSAARQESSRAGRPTSVARCRPIADRAGKASPPRDLNDDEDEEEEDEEDEKRPDEPAVVREPDED